MTCTRPPAGWSCSRIAGHEGPCAARPDETGVYLTDEEAVCVHEIVMGESFGDDALNSLMEKVTPAWERSLSADDELE